MNARFGHLPHERAAAMIQAQLGQDVAVTSCTTDAYPVGLLPPEEAAMAGASPARRREFTAGRVIARQAMATLRRPQMAVPQSPDRAPIWPDGLVGSISHCKLACVAALAPATRISALGIDLEPNIALDADLVDIICTKSERNWLATLDRPNRDVLAKLIFSAKESVFKCQYPLSKAMLEFHDIELRLDLARHQFEARFLTDADPFLANSALPGKFAMDADHITTTVSIHIAEAPA